jgi:hypothetical protein
MGSLVVLEAACPPRLRIHPLRGAEEVRHVDLEGVSAYAFVPSEEGGGSEILLLTGRELVLWSPAAGPRSRARHAFPAPTPGVPPVFLGYGRTDGDAVLVVPGLAADLLLRRGADPMPISVPRPAVVVAGGIGDLVRREEGPRAGLARVGKGGAIIPCWFEAGTLFGQDSAAPRAILTVESLPLTRLQALLRRTETVLVDLDADGRDELVIAEVRPERDDLSEVHTALRFHSHPGPGTPEGVAQGGIVLSGVLSSGPTFTDVDGDGRTDLVLSYHEAGLGAELRRRIRRTVPLSWLVYRNLGAPPFFGREPSWTEVDEVPIAHFEDWWRRHRLVFDADLDGDGRKDLVRVVEEEDWTLVEARLGRPGAPGGPGYAAGAQAQVRLPRSVAGARRLDVPGLGPCLHLRQEAQHLLLPLVLR